MQGEIGKRLAQRRIFRLRLLHPVFAEEAVPGDERGAQARRRMGLADGDEGDARRQPPRRPRRGRYPGADGVEVGRDNPFHRRSIPGTRFGRSAPLKRRSAEVRPMPVVHYRPSTGLAASLSLTPRRLRAGGRTAGSGKGRRTADGGDGSRRHRHRGDPLDGVGSRQEREAERPPGPQTGRQVSPVLYQAALDTLKFTKLASEDPLGGSLVTDWYSPRDKPDERFRIDVFILSPHLHVRCGRGDGRAPGAPADRRMGRQHGRQKSPGRSGDQDPVPRASAETGLDGDRASS